MSAKSIKVIIAVIILAVIAVAGWNFFIKSKNEPAPQAQAPMVEPQQIEPAHVKETPPVPLGQTSTPDKPDKKSIIYTDTGYSPSTLTIKKGETIIFKNISSKSMWPASAFHPSHNEYPTTGGCLGSTFDACKGVQPAASWSFKFDISGTWKYHDHLSPKKFGVIVVE